MDWKTFIVSILAIIVIGVWGICWMCIKFDLIDKDTFKDDDNKKSKKKKEK